MSFKYDGIHMDKLIELWPIIRSKLPSELSAKLNHHIEHILANENVEQIVHLGNFIGDCCAFMPVNFQHCIAFAMIATSIELLSGIPMTFRVEKSRLLAHTFSVHTEFWSNDQEKVMIAAESIWKVSSSVSNINHIIIGIHGYNQFTFNVSVILMLAAFGTLMSKEKNDKLPLLKADTFFDGIGSLDVVNSPISKRIILDFLALFQTYQVLLMLSNAHDKSIAHLLTFKPQQLKCFEEHLKRMMQSLNKSIRDQKDLTENTSIVHMIQLVLNNMDHMNPMRW